MRQHSLWKIGAAVLAGTLALSACGSNEEDPPTTPSSDGSSEEPGGETSASGEGEAACDLSLAFFGALTGDAANLGINIKQGAELAVNQYNEEHADCEVGLEELDSQGSPDQAPALAQEAINNEAVVGVVGPAFSGESAAANPLFEEAGLPIITASATNPGLAGPDIFHRMLGNDASQGPAAAAYIRDIIAAEGVFVVDDASEYGLGLADIVREDLGDLVLGSDSVQQGQTDFSATVTAVRSSGATAVFFGGYYTEAGLFTSQLADAGVEVTFVAADGVKDPGYIEAAGAEAAEGAVITCPCVPEDQAGGTFFDDYEAEFGAPPGTYSAEAFDAANVFLQGIAQGTATREDMLTWVDEYDAEGVTKQIKFGEDGEIEEIVVWAYEVQGGEIIGVQEIDY
ncbi:MAG: branched-chain amino acid ABC transporter substrate-binding protein [Actinomycetes bacterium]